MDKTFKNEISLQLTGKSWDMPDDIGEWLGRLLLLYGVPFNYLVPEEAMLPPESIRFFFLDPGWMKSLLEGACSVGKSSSMDELLDQKLRDKFLDQIGTKARKVRAGENGEVNWPLTGFLLRSDLVDGWQGLEMKASGVDRQGNRIDPLPALRIDRLSPDTMLCLFNGEVTEIEIKQPPEGLHFGAEYDPGSNTYHKRTLRKLAPAEQAGDQIDKQVNIAVPMRQGTKRVVEVERLASQMMEKLTGESAIEGPDFTSAEFSVQMVESPGKATFTVPGGAAKEHG
jgi:hypothetical protein